MTAVPPSAIEELAPRLKRLLIDSLRLEGLTPEAIGDDQPIFGEGLGLDSIDALELVVMLDKRYGIKLTEMQAAKAAFASVRTLARLVLERRPA